MKKSMYKMFKDGEITNKKYNDYWSKNKGYKNYNDYSQNYNHSTGRFIAIGKNKNVGVYLGIHIAERVLSKVFENVKHMSYGNPGYDFICSKGYKIDVKSACLGYVNNGYKDYYSWMFNIWKNKIADYFLLLAFDNRTDLNPLHIWLIKGDELINNKKLNDKMTLRISLTNKFKNYELIDKLEKINGCCNILKNK